MGLFIADWSDFLLVIARERIRRRPAINNLQSLNQQ
jgi:hypothetical protein